MVVDGEDNVSSPYPKSLPHKAGGTSKRDMLIVFALALLVGAAMAIALHHPGYTDAYYYFNAGQRLVEGKGLTDAALWTYLGSPPGLPAPSHLYWMPLSSLIAAAGMVIFGPTFDAAKIPFVLLYAALTVVAYSIGFMASGGSRRVAWLSALLTMFSGYFMPYWTTTSTFAPFGLTAGLAQLALGLGRRSGNWRYFAAAGALSALAHLTRADGVLLVGVLVVVALWPGLPRKALPALIAGLVAYLLVMTPWFVRNLNAVGTILPSGSLQTAWMRSYDEIANYPPVISLPDFLAWGPSNIVDSRWQALVTNFERFIAEQGMVILVPLMLLGLWRRRRDPFFSAFILYALGLHLVMTLVFPLPGARGGLFHSASALLPFWATLGVLGLDDVIGWLARRRHWRLTEARLVFGGALAMWAIVFSIATFTGKLPAMNGEGNYQDIAAHLDPGAVVLINDPSAMYYFTGVPGAVVPNAPPSVIPELAQRYGVNTLVLDANRTAPMNDLYEGRDKPAFLELIYHDNDIQIYRIH